MNPLDKYNGQLVAINCPTKTEAEQIQKLMKELGFTADLSRNWERPKYRENFCMTLRGNGQYCYKEWYIENGYEIVQASDILSPKNQIIHNYSIF